MQLTSLFAAALLGATALASPHPSPAEAPTKTLDKRATTICGQWDTVVTGTYTLYQDLWGEAQATSGSQCSTFTSLSGNTIVWSTSYTWAGGPDDVKSYANVVVTQSTGYEISAISTIETVYDWSYTGTGITADVSYDMFTSSTATGSNEFEIMVWLAAIGGAGPISTTGSTPIDTPTIGGHAWNLFSGPNGDTTVYSFVAQSEITSFSGDLKLFLTYLTTLGNAAFTTSQYVLSIGAGTEPFVGTDAVLSVSAYSCVFNLGGTTATTTAKTTTTTAKTTTTTTKATSTTTSAKSTSTGGSPLYGQCGGIGWTGPTTCASGTCTYSNAYYSQCVPA